MQLTTAVHECVLQSGPGIGMASMQSSRHLLGVCRLCAPCFVLVRLVRTTGKPVLSSLKGLLHLQLSH